jgi:hypothetical protein
MRKPARSPIAAVFTSPAIFPIVVDIAIADSLGRKRAEGCAMLRMFAITIAIVGLSSTLSAAPAEPPSKCTSVQARCALLVGGRCNPKTGGWRYYFPTNGNCAVRFSDCVARGGKV